MKRRAAPRRQPTAADVCADLVDAHATDHARDARRAYWLDRGWWFASGITLGAAAAAAVIVLAAQAGVPIAP